MRVQGLPLINCFAHEERHRSGFGKKSSGGFGKKSSGVGSCDRNCDRSLRDPGGCSPRGPGCLACLDHNRRPYLPDVQCVA
jgi:hypothetical protein